MKTFLMIIFDCIEFILSKVNTVFYKEYCLKLEDYYYDHKKNTYMIVLRFRNKNAIVKNSITEIINNKSLINILHPYDSYQIGTIKTMQENKYIMTNSLIERDLDDYYIIEPCVDWIGTDFTENKLIFKAKSSFSEMKVSIEEFCKDFKLIRAISSRNAFLIGSVIASSYMSSPI